MAEAALVIDLDAGQALADLKLLAEAAELSLEVRHRLLDIAKPGFEAVCFDLDLASAAAAGECRIVLQLSDPLLALASALRAGDFDFRVV